MRHKRKEERGQIIWLGKYRILSLLGEKNEKNSISDSGGVFLAEHIRLKSKRVIKRIRKGHPFYRRFAKEAVLLETLNHPCIPFLYDTEEDDQYLYLIEEYIEGTSLKDLVLSELLKEQQVIPIISQISEIILYFHHHIPPVYYLDWKPEHLILQGDKVRLVDFGAAILREEENCPADAGCFGTESFAAPEVKKGKGVGKKSDTYGLGCILFYLLTGSVYTETEAGHYFGRKVSEKRGLSAILKGCLQEEEKRRWDIDRVAASLTALEQKKNIRERKKRKKETEKKRIGVMGAYSGTGATYISIVISYYLAMVNGQRVAWLEYGNRGDGRRFLDSLESSARKKRVQVDFFPALSSETLAERLNDDYDCYVIDLGYDYEQSRLELLRCTDKIIVVQPCPWKIHEMLQFHRQIGETFRQGSWHYLYNLCEEGIGEKMPLPGVSFPWESRMDHISVRAKKVLDSLLYGKNKRG